MLAMPREYGLTWKKLKWNETPAGSILSRMKEKDLLSVSNAKYENSAGSFNLATMTIVFCGRKRKIDQLCLPKADSTVLAKTKWKDVCSRSPGLIRKLLINDIRRVCIHRSYEWNFLFFSFLLFDNSFRLTWLERIEFENFAEGFHLANGKRSP